MHTTWTFFIATALLLVEQCVADGERWGQCGGKTKPTTPCQQSGDSCIAINEWFCQCVPPGYQAPSGGGPCGSGGGDAGSSAQSASSSQPSSSSGGATTNTGGGTTSSGGGECPIKPTLQGTTDVIGSDVCGNGCCKCLEQYCYHVKNNGQNDPQCNGIDASSPNCPGGGGTTGSGNGTSTGDGSTTGSGSTTGGGGGTGSGSTGSGTTTGPGTSTSGGAEGGADDECVEDDEEETASGGNTQATGANTQATGGNTQATGGNTQTSGGGTGTSNGAGTEANGGAASASPSTGAVGNLPGQTQLYTANKKAAASDGGGDGGGASTNDTAKPVASGNLESGRCTSSRFTPATPSTACGCSGSWITPGDTPIMGAALHGSLYGDTNKCSKQCGLCYQLTGTGESPAGQGPAGQKTNSFTVMIIDACPQGGPWCSGPPNAYGSQMHFDIAVPNQDVPGPFGWDNQWVDYQKVECPGDYAKNINSCRCGLSGTKDPGNLSAG